MEKEPSRPQEEEERRLQKLHEKAIIGDISYDLRRWFGKRMDEGDAELLELQRIGYIAEAINWLESTEPDLVKYGIASQEERLAKAKTFAELAGTTIEEIAKEYNLEIPNL